MKINAYLWFLFFVLLFFSRIISLFISCFLFLLTYAFRVIGLFTFIWPFWVSVLLKTSRSDWFLIVILSWCQSQHQTCAVLCCYLQFWWKSSSTCTTPHLRRKKTTFVFLSVSIITKLKTFISFSDKCYQKMTPFLIQWLMAVKSRLAHVNVTSNFCFKIGISVSCLFSEINSWH